MNVNVLDIHKVDLHVIVLDFDMDHVSYNLMMGSYKLVERVTDLVDGDDWRRSCECCCCCCTWT